MNKTLGCKFDFDIYCNSPLRSTGRLGRPAGRGGVCTRRSRPTIHPPPPLGLVKNLVGRKALAKTGCLIGLTILFFRWGRAPRAPPIDRKQACKLNYPSGPVSNFLTKRRVANFDFETRARNSPLTYRSTGRLRRPADHPSSQPASYVDRLARPTLCCRVS